MSKINKHSDWGWGTDAYPAQEPQELQFQKDRKDLNFSPRFINKVFVWVVCGKEIAVVGKENFLEALKSVGAGENHHGPLATGTVDISNNWNLNFVVKESNIDLESLHKIFIIWAKDPHIDFEEINHPFHIDMVKDKNGIPLPVKIQKEAADPGVGDGNYPDKLWVNTDDGDIRTDIQRDYPGQGDMPATGERLTDDVLGCDRCDEVFDSYPEYLMHVVNDHPKSEPTGYEEEIRDNDEFFYPDNEASRPGGDLGIHTGSTREPIPFSFDVMTEIMHIGESGHQVGFGDNIFNKSEGYYTPEGDILIIGHPNMPYAISTLMRAWKAIYPEHEIKQVYMLRKENGVKIKERVANA
jgi:hypothetical protein